MSNFSKYRAPAITASLMIVVPLMFAFFAGAGAGTFLDGFAGMLGAFFSIFGWVSMIVGAVLMLWVGWNVLRDGAASKAING
jgi:hypothetical protein